MTAIETAKAFYPRSVTPPAKPLSLLKFVYRFLKNPLLALPQQAYEEPYVVMAERDPVIFWVSGPDIVDDILIRNAGKLHQSPIQKRVFRRALQDGILSSDGELWRWQRRTMAPIFRPSEILKYVPAMAAPAEELLERWRQSPPGSLQQVDEDMVDTTFAVIMRTMLKGGAPREAEIIRRSTAQALDHVTWEMLYGSFRLPLWLPHPRSWTLDRASRRLRGAVRDIIERRQRELDDSAEDLLGRLLAAQDPESGEPMEMDRLINNLLTLLEAGHETTSRGLAWTLYLLARSPEWQDAVRNEIRSVCGDEPLEGRHIEQLRITQQVLKESMRLYPPVPVMSRIVTQSFNAGGLFFPKASIIIIPIYCIHRHRMLWDDPDRFDPRRFAPEREAACLRTQFMPFGAGSRICLGGSFAMAEATAILATLVRSARFEWDGIVNPEPVSRITLQAKGGIALKLTMLR